jgi:sugar phosphate isomerase/epimerase
VPAGERTAVGHDLSLCWGTIAPATLEELASLGSEAGFDGISVSPGMFEDAVARGVSGDELARRITDSGVRVSVIDPLMSVLPGSPDPLTIGGRFARLFSFGEEDCFRMADTLGASAVNVAHYLGAPVALNALIDGFGALCERAELRGIELLLEFMPEGSIPDLATALSIVRAVDAPNASVMLDTWHFFRTGGIVSDLDGVAPGEVGGVQVSDAPIEQAGRIEAGVNTRLLPGDGVIPIESLIAKSVGSDATAFVGIEVFSHELLQLEPTEAANRARRSMDALVA